MVRLVKAKLKDAHQLLQIQKKCFLPLLEKYGDYENNPATMKLDRMIFKIKYQYGGYYMIYEDKKCVGGIFIYWHDDDETKFRLAQVYVLPEYSNKKIAQYAINEVESYYPKAKVWTLDTPLSEEKNCHIYEKMGYVRTNEQEVITDSLILVTYEKNMLR
jgi:GNAT superfamily N-acetyltransferase